MRPFRLVARRRAQATETNLIATTDVGTTAAPQPPIGRYRRLPVQVHQADPDAPEVARRLITLIATRWPATPAEHVGSTAVSGLAGKNTIDLLLAAEPAHLPAITQAWASSGSSLRSRRRSRPADRCCGAPSGMA